MHRQDCQQCFTEWALAPCYFGWKCFVHLREKKEEDIWPSVSDTYDKLLIQRCRLTQFLRNQPQGLFARWTGWLVVYWMTRFDSGLGMRNMYLFDLEILWYSLMKKNGVSLKYWTLQLTLTQWASEAKECDCIRRNICVWIFMKCCN